MKLVTLAATFALAASSVWADEGIREMRDHAGRLAREYKEIGTFVRAKNIDVAQLQSRLSAIESDVNKLKELAGQVEASNTSLSGHKDWKLAKDLITLIDRFHDEKADLLTQSNVSKKRSYLKTHADGLSKRAAALEQTSSRLLTHVSGS